MRYHSNGNIDMSTMLLLPITKLLNDAVVTKLGQGDFVGELLKIRIISAPGGSSTEFRVKKKQETLNQFLLEAKIYSFKLHLKMFH